MSKISLISFAAAALTFGFPACATPRTEVEATFPAALIRDDAQGDVTVRYVTTWFGRDVLVERGELRVVVSSDPTAAQDERDRETARLLEALRLIGAAAK